MRLMRARRTLVQRTQRSEKRVDEGILEILAMQVLGTIVGGSRLDRGGGRKWETETNLGS